MVRRHPVCPGHHPWGQFPCHGRGGRAAGAPRAPTARGEVMAGDRRVPPVGPSGACAKGRTCAKCRTCTLLPVNVPACAPGGPANLATTSGLIVSFGEPGSGYPLKTLTGQGREETALFPSPYSYGEPALDTN
jgi:hypothetical protein